jgi:hypothetical protein
LDNVSVWATPAVAGLESPTDMLYFTSVETPIEEDKDLEKRIGARVQKIFFNLLLSLS